MQSTVSCDRVFDALTAQPFPSGGDDDARIEDHLRACHDCRRLAEALRPAVDLLHESLRDDASDHSPEFRNRISATDSPAFGGLPTFHGFSDDDAAVRSIMAEVQSTAANGEDKVVPKSDSQPKGQQVWMANHLIGWMALATVITMAFIASQNFAGGNNDSFANDSERYGYLASSGVPTTCLSNAGWNLEPADDSHGTGVDKSCCTECHNAAPKEPTFEAPGKSVPLLAKSCRACHVASN